MSNTTNILTVFELIIIVGIIMMFGDDQYIYPLLNLNTSDNLEVWAIDDEEIEEYFDEKICPKLFDSETCEKFDFKDFKDLTKDEKKSEEIIAKYLESSEDKKPEEIMDKYFEPGDSESNSKADSELIVSDDSQLNDNLFTNQKTNDTLSNGMNQTLINNQSDSNKTKNLDDLNRTQLVDVISSEIFKHNDSVEKIKIIKAIDDLITSTEAQGGNVMKSLKSISEKILKDPSGSLAKKIISIAQGV